MHCSADFDTPVEADGGAPVEGRRQTDRTATDDDDATTGAKLVGVVLAVVALGTLPLVAPPNALLFVFASAVGVGLYATRQPTPTDAVRAGGTALAVAPFLLWFVSPLLNGLGSFSLGTLFGPAVYAAVVASISRRFG